MAWVGITLVAVWMGLAVVVYCHPDRRHTRPPTYRRRRRAGWDRRSAGTRGHPGIRP